MSDDDARNTLDKLLSDELKLLLCNPKPIPYSAAPFLPRPAAATIENAVLDWWLRKGGGLKRVASSPGSIEDVRATALTALCAEADNYEVDVVPAADGSISVSCWPKVPPAEQAAIDARTHEIAADNQRLLEIFRRSQQERKFLPD